MNIPSCPPLPHELSHMDQDHGSWWVLLARCCLFIRLLHGCLGCLLSLANNVCHAFHSVLKTLDSVYHGGFNSTPFIQVTLSTSIGCLPFQPQSCSNWVYPIMVWSISRLTTSIWKFQFCLSNEAYQSISLNEAFLCSACHQIGEGREMSPGGQY